MLALALLRSGEANAAAAIDWAQDRAPEDPHDPLSEEARVARLPNDPYFAWRPTVPAEVLEKLRARHGRE